MTKLEEIRTDIITRLVSALIVRGNSLVGMCQIRDMCDLAGSIADMIMQSVSTTDCDEPMKGPLKDQLTKALDEIAALRKSNIECSRMASVAQSKLNDLEADVVQLLGHLGSQTTIPASPALGEFLSRHPNLNPQGEPPF